MQNAILTNSDIAPPPPLDFFEDEQYIQDVAKAIEGFVKRRKQRDVTRKKLINLLETPP